MSKDNRTASELSGPLYHGNVLCCFSHYVPGRSTRPSKGVNILKSETAAADSFRRVLECSFSASNRHLFAFLQLVPIFKLRRNAGWQSLASAVNRVKFDVQK